MVAIIPIASIVSIAAIITIATINTIAAIATIPLQFQGINKKQPNNLAGKEKGSTFAPQFLGDSLAQQVEHIPFKDGVVGSSPTRITMTGNCPSFFYP